MYKKGKEIVNEEFKSLSNTYYIDCRKFRNEDKLPTYMMISGIEGIGQGSETYCL